MEAILFDLDNTLIAGDSDYLWGCFLVEQGIVDGASYEHANLRFYDQYKVGELDIFEFLAFQLRPLSEHDLAQLELWRAQYIQEKIVPILLPKARVLIDRHRANGDILVIITATNRFITAPIARLYGIDHLLATPEPEEPIRLVQPHVLYEFADPELEALSGGQKLLIRMGPDHISRIKAVLSEVRTRIAQP